MINIIKEKKIAEIIRFGIVGVVATAINYLVYTMFDNIIGVNIAYTLGYVTSLVFNFLLSNYYTFKTNPTRDKSFKFILAHGFNYLLQMTLLNVFIKINISNEIAPIFVYCISIPINFLLVRKVLSNK